VDGRHPRDGSVSEGISLRQLTSCHHLLDLLLPLVFELFELFIRVKVFILVKSVPTFVFFKFISLGLLKKLIITNHSILVLITFFEDMLPHPFHLLLPLPLIIFRCIRIISFV
jgi:hypothetical protein